MIWRLLDFRDSSVSVTVMKTKHGRFPPKIQRQKIFILSNKCLWTDFKGLSKIILPKEISMDFLNRFAALKYNYLNVNHSKFIIKE